MAQKSEIITSDDILGKDVVDVDGQVLGVAQQLKIDKRSKKILGILIDQGFMKADLFVGLNYISNFGVDSVFLNTTPFPKLKGLNVYSKDGRKLGKVVEVEEAENGLSAIILKPHLFSKSLRINGNQIKTVGYSIILKKRAEEILVEGKD